MDNKRKFTRINFETITTIKYKNHSINSKLLDLSLKGAFLEVEKDNSISINENCLLEINLSDSNIVLNIEAKLVHIANNNLGFKFLSMDIESLTHLRRLLEINMGNSEQISRELYFLSTN